MGAVVVGICLMVGSVSADREHRDKMPDVRFLFSPPFSPSHTSTRTDTHTYPWDDHTLFWFFYALMRLVGTGVDPQQRLLALLNLLLRPALSRAHLHGVRTSNSEHTTIQDTIWLTSTSRESTARPILPLALLEPRDPRARAGTQDERINGPIFFPLDFMF